ncbi:MAG: hypothetical protein A2Y50_09090 [Pseudomonadales bacterium RIFCSPLOWO2_12_59_9]|nr:MAG: hypothetical protein A2Y50_09090 [Pseudomonadales bacterium RIFCSPLOWO2_12_59_9]
MSWSVSAIGKPSAVAEKLASQFAAIKCMEPEETIKNHVASAVAVALKAFPASYAVKVDASGSQSTSHAEPGVASNQLSVKIEPLWGFCE